MTDGIPYAWKTGYFREAVWNTSTIVDTNGGAGSAGTRAFGRMGDDEATVHPTPEAMVQFGDVDVNKQEVDSGDVVKTHMETKSGMYTIGIQNGVLFQLVMGLSATVDDSPSAGYNTHTITPPAAIAGALPLLDSFTIHHDKIITGTDWSTQYTGCKVSKLELHCTREDGFLIAVVNWINGGSTTPAFQLAAAPTLPGAGTSAHNPDPFLFQNVTITYDSNDITKFVSGLRLEIIPGLDALNVDTENWPDEILEALRKDYSIYMDMVPYSDTIYDDLLATTNNKDLVIKLTRDATNDYIEITLSRCWVLKHELITPERGEPDIAEVKMKPEALSISVVDKLEGSDYGE